METAMNYLPKHVARRKVKNGEKSPWGQCLTRPALLAVLYFSSFHIYFSARLDFPSPPLSLPGSPRMSKGGMIVSYMPKGQWLILCCCPIIGRGITNFLQILAIRPSSLRCPRDIPREGRWFFFRPFTFQER